MEQLRAELKRLRAENAALKGREVVETAGAGGEPPEARGGGGSEQAQALAERINELENLLYLRFVTAL
jgi:hypothetical protein